MGREVLERFGMLVRERRLELGLSQEGLSLACGLDRSYIGSIERGQRNVSLLNVERIARALEVDVRDLL
jgi:transcriptional regulator with XRE-family HTH domain